MNAATDINLRVLLNVVAAALSFSCVALIFLLKRRSGGTIALAAAFFFPVTAAETMVMLLGVSGAAIPAVFAVGGVLVLSGGYVAARRGYGGAAAVALAAFVLKIPILFVLLNVYEVMVQ